MRATPAVNWPYAVSSRDEESSLRLTAAGLPPARVTFDEEMPLTLPASPTHPISPATLVMSGGGPYAVWIGTEVRWERSDGGPPLLVTLHAMSEERSFPCSVLDEVSPCVWAGCTWSDGGFGEAFTVRPTVEEDSLKAVSMSGQVEVPMPVAVIADLHSDSGGGHSPALLALVRDELVSGLMLRTNVGPFLRSSGRWHLVTHEDSLRAFALVEADECSLKLFDQRSKAGEPFYLAELGA